MDFLQSSLGNKQYQDELNKYLMNLKKQKDSKLSALQDNQNIDPDLDIMLNRDITSPDYGQVPIKFPQTPSTVKETPKSNALTDRQKFAKTLGISEQTLNALDANTTDLSKGIDSLTAGKDLSAFMNVNAPSKTIEAGTPPTGAEAIAPAGTTATGQSAKPQNMATGIESPKPQEDDFGNRMAATAVGNILGSLGAGLAGYSPTSVNQMFQGLYTQLNQKQKEKEIRDPNSQISKNYRDLVSPYLPKGLDISNKSAFELEKVIPFAMQKAQQEQQMEIARMNVSASRQNATAIRELSQRRFEQNIQNKAFSDIEKEYTKLFSPEDADFRRSLYEARDLAKQIGVGKGTIQRLATGGFRAIAGPSGVIDPKASALAIKLGQLETYLAKDTGEVGNLTADERKPYRDNLPRINDANIVPFFNQLISTHEAKRKDRVNRFTAKVDRVNKNYGTSFNPMENLKEIEGYDVTPEETSTPNIKIPKFDLKL